MTKLLRAALLAVLTIAMFASPALAASGGSTAPTAGTDATTSPRAGDTADVTLKARGAPIVARKISFKGTVASGDPDLQVSIQRRDPAEGWLEIATAKTREDGSFGIRWKADVAGTFEFRAVVRGEAVAARTSGASGSVSLSLYRSKLASTFFDRETACGKRLRRSTLGVAHKTLPCGTKVAFYYRGRTITVPVVDRGPYRRGYSWDLTEAAAEKLGFEGIGRVGSLVLGAP